MRPLKSFRVQICLFIVIAACFQIQSLRSQPQWRWVQDDRVLNPNGLSITDFSFQIEIIDWDGDADWDIIVNQYNKPQLFENIGDESNCYWIKRELEFPETSNYYSWPGNIKTSNFSLIDLDHDGDWDLASDDPHFWWNVGANQAPIWTQADSVFAAFGLVNNLSFADVNFDGLWDVLAEVSADYDCGIKYFENQGTKQTPVWNQRASVLPPPDQFGEPATAACFVDIDQNSQWELAGFNILVPMSTSAESPILKFVPISYCLTLLKNNGNYDSPLWEKQQFMPFICWGYDIGGPTSYRFIDFDHDGDLDLMSTNPRRQLEWWRTLSPGDTISFSQKPIKFGAINVQRNAFPVLFNHGRPGQPDLIVIGDFTTPNPIDEHTGGYFQSSYESFANANGTFNLNTTNNGWFLIPDIKPFAPKIPCRNLRLSFADFDNDGDTDFALSYFELTGYLFNQIKCSRVLLFTNEGTDRNTNWRADSSALSFFDKSTQLFHSPCFVDIDHDGDQDIFINSARGFRFFCRDNPARPIWSERTSLFLSGFDQSQIHSVTFNDLNLDGNQDIVAGDSSGTLSVFWNIGTAREPNWLTDTTNVFAGIDVDSLATPAFGDIDGDGDHDFIIGNADGLLSYYRNENMIPHVDPLGYYPLALGNCWEYERVVEGSSYTGRFIERVIGDTVIFAKKYWIIKTSFGNSAVVYFEYYRVDSTLNRLYFLSPIDWQEYWQFSFDAKIGDLMADDSMTRCDHIRDETVFSHNVSVKSFVFEIPLAEFQTEFAHDFGIIRKNTVGHGTDSFVRLIGAFINGVGYGTLTTVDALQSTEIPENYVLHQNYPNPFNPSTTIRYDLPKPAFVTLTIYNILGENVRTLVSEMKEAGNYQMHWDGKNDRGEVAHSGVYLYALAVGDFKEMKKMVLLR